MSKKVYSERIIIIGSSQSGKTYFACENIVPFFKYVHYIGPVHNVRDYANALSKGSVMNVYEDPFQSYQILLTAEKFYMDQENLVREGLQDRPLPVPPHSRVY